MARKIGYFYTYRVVTAKVEYEQQESRKEDKRFYSRARWVKLAAAYKRENPLCAGKDCRALADHVDHVLDRKLHPDLAFEWDNLQGLCVGCHNRKRHATH